MKEITQILIIIIISTAILGCGNYAKLINMGPEQSQHPPRESNKAGYAPNLPGGSESENRKGNKIFYHGPTGGKKVALTFDDGPDVTFTNKILKILQKNGIKATFFIVGQRASKHPEMVKRILKEGHAIGNHTWNHPKLTDLTDTQIKQEIDKTNDFLLSLTGYTPRIFRPPYGLADQRVMHAIADTNMQIIDWSVDTRDWAGTPVANIMDFVKKEVTPGGIVLQHCAGRGENLNNTVASLPIIIEYLKKQGYQFATVPELLSIPVTNEKTS